MWKYEDKNNLPFDQQCCQANTVMSYVEPNSTSGDVSVQELHIPFLCEAQLSFNVYLVSIQSFLTILAVCL